MGDVIKHSIPNWVINCAAVDCKTAEEFAYKYRKAERFTHRGEDYIKAIMKSHLQELKDHGYTCISRHDNVTGEFITFIEKNSNRFKEALK